MTIRFTDRDYFAFPKLRWTVCHFRQLMPTIGVDNGPEGARELATALDASLDAVTFTPLGAQETMTWKDAFDANYTDGIIVMHHGRVVYERYGGCLDRHTLHGAMSVTESLTGLLGEMLVAEGKLDQSARMSSLNGQSNGVQIVPQAAVSSIRTGGNPKTFAKTGYDLLKGWSCLGM